MRPGTPIFETVPGIGEVYHILEEEETVHVEPYIIIDFEENIVNTKKTDGSLCNFPTVTVSDINGIFEPTAREYEVVKIPGRNGDLIIDTGRKKNTTIEIKCYIMGDWSVTYPRLVNTLTDIVGYKEVIVEGHTVYKTAKYYRVSDDSVVTNYQNWRENIVDELFNFDAYYVGCIINKLAPRRKGGELTLIFSAKPAYQSGGG